MVISIAVSSPRSRAHQRVVEWVDDGIEGKKQSEWTTWGSVNLFSDDGRYLSYMILYQILRCEEAEAVTQ